MRPAAKAWGAIGLGVAAYEVLCPHGETLSEGVDQALEHSRLRRAATVSAIAVTALHLCNAIPEKLDPFHYALLWKD